MTPCPRSMRQGPAFLLLAFILSLCSCAARHQALRRHDDLVAAGQWFNARQSFEELALQGQAPEDLSRRVALLTQRARQHVDNLDLNPLDYFYARAYLEYFEYKRYSKARDALRQVLTYELDNEEVVRFLDKSQTRVEQELKEQPVAKKRERPAKPAAVVATPPVAAPAAPDIERLEARYDEALTAYFKREMSKARGILQEIAREDPSNSRYRKVLERIDRELQAVTP